MSWLLLFFFAALLSCCFALVFFGSRNAFVPVGEKPAPGDTCWPKVTAIVPAAGLPQGLDACLASLQSQDYPDYELIFVTADWQDPAAAVIQQSIGTHKTVRLICSGEATSCGQKNHSILAALKVASDDTEVFVFCDSTRTAPPFWLKSLILPIATGTITITSGYHHIVFPKNAPFAVRVHACIVLMLYITRGIRRLMQPWGGSMAIARNTFQSLKIAELWSRNVVDDVSLAAHLKKMGVAVCPVPEACLATPLEQETAMHWLRWMDRQWLYLKFCLPASWALAGLFCYGLSSAILLSAAMTIMGLLGAMPLMMAAMGALFLIVLAVLGLVIHSYHPDAGSRPAWLAAGFTTLIAASLSHIRSVGLSKIRWKSKRYAVGKNGVVTGIFPI